MAKPDGIEAISIDADYTLDRDLTFNDDGFIVMTDNITLDLNGHTITGSTMGRGITLEGRAGVTVKNGIIEQFDDGFFLMESHSNTLTGNTVRNTWLNGFLLMKSHGNTLTGNTAVNNSRYGIWVVGSNDNILTGNMATDNKDGFLLKESSGNILTGNTALNNPGNGFLLELASGNTFTGNTATGSKYGFFLYESRNNTLTGNTVTDNQDGFVLGSSSGNNTLTGNTATHNNNSGFSLEFLAMNNHLTGNIATDNQDGFALSDNGNDNILTGNTAMDNNNGFILSHNHGNILTGNTATNNSNYGISLDWSYNNTIYNNYFDNDQNAYEFLVIGSNAWNITKTSGPNIIGGPYLGGNFWSDYTGLDADGDEIGDIPYLISAGTSHDHLPLVRVAIPALTVSEEPTHTSALTVSEESTVSTPYVSPPTISGTEEPQQDKEEKKEAAPGFEVVSGLLAILFLLWIRRRRQRR